MSYTQTGHYINKLTGSNTNMVKDKIYCDRCKCYIYASQYKHHMRWHQGMDEYIRRKFKEIQDLKDKHDEKER